MKFSLISAAVLLQLLLATNERVKGDGWTGCTTGQLCENDPEPLGCFENGPKTPWCHQFVLPQKISLIQPQFYFLTPDMPGKQAQQDIDFFHLTPSVKALRNIDIKRQLVVVVHGFGDGWPRRYTYPMADALTSMSYNVLLVRWDIGSADPDYLQATANTRIMGAALARVLKVIESELKYSPLQFTLVGFSLGAHVVGFAGARLINLRRIIALDPAGPLYAKHDPFYMGMSPITRLNYTDANLVVCIHTDGLPLDQGGAGTVDAFGDIDFYPNGGQIQPGCGEPASHAVGDLTHFNWTEAFDALLCPHARSDWLFITSILNSGSPNSCKFTAFPCEQGTKGWKAGLCTDCGPKGCPSAGIEVDSLARQGKYYFSTHKDNTTSGLFCGNQYKLTLSPEKLVHGEIIVQVGGSETLGEKVTLQSRTTYLYPNHEVSGIVVGDFADEPLFVEITYNRNENFFDGGTKKFGLGLLVVTELVGNKNKYSMIGGYQVNIVSGTPIKIPVSKYV